MSRTWERKIRKNQAYVNRMNKKKSVMDPFLFQGRNYFLPIGISLMIVLYSVLYHPNQPGKEYSPGLYWFTLISYALLAMIVFFRKPYLRIQKNEIVTTRFNKIKRLNVSEITQIIAQKGSIVIEHSGKGGNWVFSKLINLYDTEALQFALEKFAKEHRIPYDNRED